MPRTPTSPSPATAPGSAGYLPWLTAMAVAYALTHHVGFGTAWLGTIGPTRWADWIDIITPYAVLLTAAAALYSAGAGRRIWVVYLVGALTYTEGHGIHLAANSVGNTAPGDTAHLWDEVVGHYLWYAGLTLVLAALAMSLARRPALRGPRSQAVGIFLALATGLTWTTNSLEGGTAVMGLVVAAGFTGWGWAARSELGRLLIVTFAPAVVLLAGYGVWHRGFPQPSDIGWV